jgi:hypothetical protein
MMYASACQHKDIKIKALANALDKSNSKRPFSKPVSSKAAQLKKTVSITNEGISGESSDSETETRMNKTFGNKNFKNVYETVTADEPGFPKFSCAEPSALSKLVENSNKGNIYSKLQGAVFGMTKDDNISSLPSKYLDPGPRESKRQFNTAPGRNPERFRRNNSESAAYLDPCGTCCLWLHPSSKDTFRVMNSLKNNFK